MVKNLHITFDDEDYEFLLKIKGAKEWRDFVMDVAKMIESLKHEFKSEKK